MIGAPERSAERDAALAAMMKLVPELGWGMAALRRALADIGAEPLDAELLFPGGTSDLIEAHADLADRQMEADAAAADVQGKPLPERVRAVIALRLRRQAPHKDAIRRALAVLAVPGHARLAMRCTARTVDSIWHAAGDTSADFSWYTKRATLTGVYTSTLLFWLRDDSDDAAATLAFLDRRLAGVGRVHRLRRRAEAFLQRVTPCGPAAEQPST